MRHLTLLFPIVAAAGLLAALLLPAKPSTAAKDGGKPSKSANPMAKKNALKQIGVQLALFESRFKKYPDSWDEMIAKAKIPAEQFLCPDCGQPFTYLPGGKGTYQPPGSPAYSWGPDGVTDGAPPDLPMAICENCARATEPFEVLFFQGRVDYFKKDSDTGKAVLGFAKAQAGK